MDKMSRKVVRTVRRLKKASIADVASRMRMDPSAASVLMHRIADEGYLNPTGDKTSFAKQFEPSIKGNASYESGSFWSFESIALKVVVPIITGVLSALATAWVIYIIGPR